MTEAEIEAMIQRAAEAGAKKALRDVGLDSSTDNNFYAFGLYYCWYGRWILL